MKVQHLWAISRTISNSEIAQSDGNLLSCTFVEGEEVQSPTFVITHDHSWFSLTSEQLLCRHADFSLQLSLQQL